MEIAAGQRSLGRLEPAGVDAVGGDGGVGRRLHVGGREPEGLAALVAPDHHALDPVEAAELVGGGRDVTVGEVLADQRGRDVLQAAHQGHPDGDEVVFLAEFAQGGQVAGGLVAEPEVLPHHDPGGVEPVDQGDLHELLGGGARELQRERQDQHRVDPEGAEQLDAPVGGGELRRVAAGPHHLVGVGVEGHRDRGDPELPGELDGLAHQRLVTPVNAVEHPDRDDGPAPVRRHVVKSEPAAHVDPQQARKRSTPKRPTHVRSRGPRASTTISPPVPPNRSAGRRHLHQCEATDPGDP